MEPNYKNKDIAIVVDFDLEADSVYFLVDGESVCAQDFFENADEFTWDDSACLINVMERDYCALKEYEEFLDDNCIEYGYDDIEPLYYVCASEAVAYAVERLAELGYTNVEVARGYEPSEKSSNDMYGEMRLMKEQELWLHKLDNTELLEELLVDSDIDVGELVELIRHNFQTRGKASMAFLKEDGILDCLAEENYDEEDIVDEIIGLYRAMSVARHRHLETDYDAVSKRGMTDEQVAALRRSYNN